VPGARNALPDDRRERRAGRHGRRVAHPEGKGQESRLQRRHRRVRRPPQGGRRGPGEGHSQRAAKRGERRVPVAHYGRHGGPHSRAEEGRGRPSWSRRPRHGWDGRHGRNGWHGWHDVTNRTHTYTLSNHTYWSFDHGEGRQGAHPEAAGRPGGGAVAGGGGED